MSDEELDERTVAVDRAVKPPAFLGHVHKPNERVDVRPRLEGAMQRCPNANAGDKRGKEKVLLELVLEHSVANVRGLPVLAHRVIERPSDAPTEATVV
jgi:hypothetical protein